MSSRVEKFENIVKNDMPSRMEKNQDLYKDINKSTISSFGVASNSTIIENIPNKIDIDKIKNYVNSLAEKNPITRREIVKEDFAQNYNQKSVEQAEEKIYDINSVIEKAKENRENYYETEKYRKLHDTQYDILNKINLNSSEEDDNFDFNEEEKTLIDLINTISVNKKSLDLLSELRGTIDEEKIEPMKDLDLKSDLTKPIVNDLKNEKDFRNKEPNNIAKDIDKSFYTNSMSFSKEDFDGFEELEKAVKKNNLLVKFSIILLIVLGIVTIYVIIKYLF